MIVLALASYRFTRIAVIDSIFEGTRARFHAFLATLEENHPKFRFVAQKLLDLTSCTWCLGIWISFALYWIYVWSSPWDFSRVDVINIFAIAGIQGLLHSFEPDDA